MKKIQITSNRMIGDGEFPFVIAEIGNNHNGDIDNALKMIKIAKDIGVDAVKFQVKDVETSFSKELLDKPYSGPNSFGKTYREHKMALEFSEEQLKQLYNYADEIGIICFSTPFDINSVHLLEKLNNPIYKISSFHVTDLKLIEEICKTQKPIILSTGMSSLQEIDAAVTLIRKYHEQFTILQCTSSYPTDDQDVNLKVIPFLSSKFNCPVGYSGHEKGLVITCASIALGACVIERHFTLDRTMKGPDHASSLEPTGMGLVVTRSKRIFNSLGSSEKKVLDCELENRKKFRGY
jgi:sialic acid synthase